MNFLACNGDWFADANGLHCSGQLVSFTGQELASEINRSSGITPEDSTLLYDAALQLFVSVFVFLVLKKMIR